jgi:hypothetical protein
MVRLCGGFGEDFDCSFGDADLGFSKQQNQTHIHIFRLQKVDFALGRLLPLASGVKILWDGSFLLKYKKILRICPHISSSALAEEKAARKK